MLTKRSYLGMALWSLGYNISVAVAALFFGIGIALLLISARHILLGFPASSTSGDSLWLVLSWLPVQHL